MTNRYSEETFKRDICKVLGYHKIEFETEYQVTKRNKKGKGNHTRKCDIYIPETDTAIELKLKPNLRGVGQCALYARHHKEAILLADGDPEEGVKYHKATHDAIKTIPNAKYGLCIPGENKLSIRSKDNSLFFNLGRSGELGESGFQSILQKEWDYKKPPQRQVNINKHEWDDDL